MKQSFAVVGLIIGLLIGALVGYVAGNQIGLNSLKTSITELRKQVFSSKTESRSADDCVKERLGEEKAALYAANPNLLAAEDNLAILPCVES